MPDMQNAGFIFSVILGFLLVPIGREIAGFLHSVLEDDRESGSEPGFFRRHGRLLRTLSLVALLAVVVYACVYFEYIDTRYEFSPGQFVEGAYYGSCSIWGLELPGCLFIVPRMVVDLSIGILAGFLIRRFWKLTSENKDVGALLFVSRLVPIILLLGVGLFRDDIGPAVRAATAVKTPYFEITFNQINADDGQARFKFESDAVTTETDFQKGHFAFQSSIDAPLRDANKILNICKDDRLQLCRSALYKADENEISKAESFEDIFEYVVELQKFKGCLDIFVRNFENGVPIQDELSELAIAYAKSLFERDEAEPGPAATLQKAIEQMKGVPPDMSDVVRGLVERLQPEWALEPNDPLSRVSRNMSLLRQIFGAVMDGAQLYPDRNSSQKCALTASDFNRIMDKIRTNSIEYETTIIRNPTTNAIRRVSADGQVAPNPLPYRVMLGSSILLMSGHPVEAAQHLERETARWIERRVGLDGINRATFHEDDLLTFLSGLQLLARREYLFDRAGLQQELPSKRADIIGFLRGYLSAHSNVAFKGGDGGTLRNVLTSCIDGEALAFQPGPVERLVEAPSSAGGEALALQVDAAGRAAGAQPAAGDGLFVSIKDLKGELEKHGEYRPITEAEYIKSLLHYFVYLMIEHYISIARSGDSIAINHIEGTREMFELATNQRALLQECFGERTDTRGNVLGYDWRVMRVKFALRHAEMLARKAQQVQDERVVASRRGFGQEAVTRYLCKAEKALLVTLELADAVPKPAMGNGDQASQVKAWEVGSEHELARRMLQKIPPNRCEDAGPEANPLFGD